MRVAVIGTGIAGNAAAWALSKRYPVTVYERELRPGGHSHTVTIDYDGAPVAVDIGFIVYNELNYPDLTELFAHLGVETVESCMSFAVTADAGRFEWKGGGSTWGETARGLFAQPKNLFSPSYLRMLRDILTFNERSVKDRDAGLLADKSLGEYFAWRKFAPRLLTDYLAPVGAAIWSAPAGQILNVPAENFVAFFNNHRLLQYDRPVWRTVKGGSKRYVEKLMSAFGDHLRLGCAVTSIERTAHGVIVSESHGRRQTYDHVVVASHSDQALAMLSDPSAAERRSSGCDSAVAGAAARTGRSRGVTMQDVVARTEAQPNPAHAAAALYFGEVMHARLKPMGHRFSYRVMSLLIDLDQFDAADTQTPLFGINRAALYSFRESDHGHRDGSSLRAYGSQYLRRYPFLCTAGATRREQRSRHPAGTGQAVLRFALHRNADALPLSSVAARTEREAANPGNRRRRPDTGRDLQRPAPQLDHGCAAALVLLSTHGNF
jgi:hypothetical protein